MPSEPIQLSLIVPVYNEASRIGAPLGEMGEFLDGLPYACEIVIVDDGSRDRTAAIVREVAATLCVPVRLVRYEWNRGKGYALKVGFQLARGERLLFTDCDLSTPLHETHRLLAALDEGYDFAIGSRKLPGSEIAEHQPRLREFLGTVFTLIVRRLIAPVSDATCGFKAYDRNVGRDLFAHLAVEDWSFDAEALFIARRRGYRWKEVPVHWEDRAGTKVNLLHDVMSSLVGLVRIRLNDLLGRYSAPVEIGPTHEECCARLGEHPAEAASESTA